MKIDIFSHIATKNYMEKLQKKAQNTLPSWMFGNPPLSEVDIRSMYMDRYPDVLQVLTMSEPPLAAKLVTTEDAIELAQIANEDLAEMVAKYPDRFIAAVACLPLTDIDASLKEAERAITQLKLRGVQIFTNINGEPLGTPRFKPLYEMMARYDLPIWIHPTDNPKPAASDFSLVTNLIGGFGWPFESTVAMSSLVAAGVFKDVPNIKFIIHHCGGMIPFYSGRIGMGPNQFKAEGTDDFKKFYVDTALHGNTPALMCGYDYFGINHLLFGTDAPLGGVPAGYTLQTIRAIDRMPIPEVEKDKIYIDNAIKLMKLAI
jgi:uncharacterized protein